MIENLRDDKEQDIKKEAGKDSDALEVQREWDEADKKVKILLTKLESITDREEDVRFRKEELRPALEERTRMANLYKGMRHRQEGRGSKE